MNLESSSNLILIKELHNLNGEYFGIEFKVKKKNIKFLDFKINHHKRYLEDVLNDINKLIPEEYSFYTYGQPVYLAQDGKVTFKRSGKFSQMVGVCRGHNEIKLDKI